MSKQAYALDAALFEPQRPNMTNPPHDGNSGRSKNSGRNFRGSRPYGGDSGGLRVYRQDGQKPPPKPANAQTPAEARALLPRASADPARHGAAILLWQVLEEGRTLDEAMRQTQAYRNLDARDKGFAAAIVRASLRHMGHINAMLDTMLERPLPETAYYVRAILRTALGQWLEEIAPDHALAQSAVALAKSDRIAAGMGNLVNAILRRAMREGRPNFPAILNLPSQWRTRILARFGAERAENIAKALMSAPPLDLSIKGDPAPIMAALTEAGEIPELLGQTIRLKAAGRDVASLPMFEQGAYWVQDFAASLPALILSNLVAAPARVADMCAAPGGKAMQLAAMGYSVLAIDNAETRMKRVSENLERTGLHIALKVMDARQIASLDGFDAILLDAPCSATGTWRRHPEAPWLRDPSEAGKLLPIQADLIAAAAKGLKAGGYLVFSICSLEADEAEAARGAALSAGLVQIPLGPEHVPELAGIEGFGLAFDKSIVQTAPDILAEIGGMDGFFIAAFQKPLA